MKKRQMERNIAFRVKNDILRSLAAFSILALVVSGCFFGSDSALPYLISGFCLAYLFLFAWANDWFTEGWHRKDGKKHGKETC